MPTYQEMMEMFGYKSKNSVYKLVQRLVSQGAVDQDSQGRLIPKKGFNQIKLLGQIEAGFPVNAEEEIIDTMSLDEFLIKDREASYLLEVDGESMKDAGIMPGDLVLVEKTDQAKNGDIVIAEVDNEWTIKYLKKNNGSFYLEPANDNFKPIYPENKLKITAVVRAVIRKCR